MVTLNLRLYETQQEEKFKPISRYPIPYKKDLPFDIVELMEEIENKVRHSTCAGGHTASVTLLAGVESLEIINQVCPSGGR